MVALKVLTRADGAARFAREASVLSSLGHSGVVQYVTHDTTDRGKPFLAMEWLKGETLAQYLRRESPTIRESVDLVRGVAETLGAVHRAGVVHRDLKPSNLFLVESDVRRVKVLDFGLARMDLVQPILTMSGQLVGTPGYISPEQARGDLDIDARTDVFSLGCVLFRCLADRPAFAGTTETVLLAKVIFDEPDGQRALDREISAPLAVSLARLLEKDPSRRPGEGFEVAELLGELTSEDLEPRPDDVDAPPESSAAGVTVVLARQPFTDDVDTVPSRKSQIPMQGLSLRARALAHGLSHTTLATGADVVISEGFGGEAVARAARWAIDVRSVEPRLPVAIATGSPAGAAVERAAILLEQREVTGARIRICDDTAAEMPSELLVTSDAHSKLLTG
jgi:serine/threonine protein kinase